MYAVVEAGNWKGNLAPSVLSRRLRSRTVTERAGKTLVLSLIGRIAAVVCACAVAAGAQDKQADILFQPQGLKHVGIYAVRETDPDLTGEGVKYAVICRSFSYVAGKQQNNYRPAVEHECFANARFTFFDNGELPVGASPHATAICSILFGEDPAAFHPKMGRFYYEGTTPNAQANIYEFEHFLLKNVGRHLPPEEDIIAAGLGSPLEDWWTRGIEALAEHYGKVIVAGIGNGDDADHTVLYPGAGANAIGVGVVDSVNTDDPAISLAHFALAYPEHSSFGAAGNGYSKPDIVAPGNCLAAGTDEPNAYEATGDWSSFATPIVAGAAGLLVQKARQDPALSLAVAPTGGNCVIKAILLNSARKLPYWHKGRLEIDDDHISPLDQIQGAGLLNALGAYEQLVAGQIAPGSVPPTGWDLNLLTSDTRLGNAYRMALAEPIEGHITATVTWNRHYERNFPFKRSPDKDGNLRLELWAVDPIDPARDYLLDYSDSPVDNVEHIYAAADPNYTNYEVVVSFSDIDAQPEVNPEQLYGLAWTVSEKQETDDILSYDLNADGIVNELDIILALNSLANRDKSPNSYLIGDVNSDGEIDARDLGELLNQTKSNRRADWRVEQENKAG